MTNSVNSFHDIEKLFGQLLGQAAEDFLGYDGREEYEERPHVRIPKKPSRMQRMKTQIDFNIKKFTNHRYVGNGIKAVNKRKFNPEVN